MLAAGGTPRNLSRWPLETLALVTGWRGTRLRGGPSMGQQEEYFYPLPPLEAPKEGRGLKPDCMQPIHNFHDVETPLQ